MSQEGKSTEHMDKRRLLNQSDKLLRNYEQLQFLENSRDEILCGIHEKLANDNDKEQQVRSASFLDVNVQSDSLFEDIRDVFLRLHTLMGSEDLQLLKTCVEIVDKEEIKDNNSMATTLGHEPFVTSGRPKGWRKQCMDIIASQVSERVKVVCPIPPSPSVKSVSTSFVLHLTKARDNIKTDLDHAKTLIDVFTEEWDLFSTYGRTYYFHLMSQMEKRFSFDLNYKETVEVLSWMILCRDKVFNCPDAECLPCRIIDDLQNKYLKEKGDHIHEWMENALKKDISDWHSLEKPKVDRQDALYTEFPIVILRMLQENLNQAKDISPELYKNISQLGLEELNKIMSSYTEKVKLYISQETTNAATGGRFAKRNAKECARKTSKEPRPIFLVQYSVALLNNFDQITSHLQQNQEDHTTIQDDSTNNNNTEWEHLQLMERLIHKMKTQTQECTELLLSKLVDDMGTDLSSLLTRNWLMGNEKEAVETICETTKSYLHHLREPFCSSLVPSIGDTIVEEYVRGLTDKRIKCEGKEEDRLAVYDKLCREFDQLTEFLQGFNPAGEEQLQVISRWDVVKQMAGVIQATDEETITTNMIVISSKYPDIVEKQAQRLLKVRGDLSKAQINKIVSSSLGKKHKKSKHGREEKKTVFSKLTLQ